MIPKVFHFVWLDRGKQMGDLEFTSILSKVALYGNEFKYILWVDNKDFRLPYQTDFFGRLEVKYLHSEVPKLKWYSRDKRYWDIKSGVPFECDYYRFQLLNKLGGIYSDLDSISIKKLPEQYFKYSWVSCIEHDPKNRNVYGSFIGFFMCEAGCDYLYRFLYLRDRILPKYSPNNQLGILCGQTEGTRFIRHKRFQPLNFTEIPDWIRSNSEIIDFANGKYDSYEFHIFTDWLKNYPQLNEYLKTKLYNYQNYLLEYEDKFNHSNVSS
jgi:hypothetical protein